MVVGSRACGPKVSKSKLYAGSASHTGELEEVADSDAGAVDNDLLLVKSSVRGTLH